MLNDTFTTPPSKSGKWECEIPETRKILLAESFDELLRLAKEHYSANGFTYGKALSYRVQKIICDRLKREGIRGYCYDDPIPIEEFVQPIIIPSGLKVARNIPRLKKLIR